MDKGHPVRKAGAVTKSVLTKYRKGDFTVVPNMNNLHVLSPQAQSIYLWICYFSDDLGICFPSRTTLAEKLMMKDPRSVDKYITELAYYSFIEVIKRKDDNGIYSGDDH